MSDRTPCATPEALVTYLYEECEPAERQSIAAHIAICSACAEEILALGDTRAHLASWSPPAMPLGFQITRTESDQPATVLDFAGSAIAPKPRGGEGGWWRKPLPAWAQAAAAVVIFAAGMSVNALRSPGEQPAQVVAAPATQPAVVADAANTDDLRVTREEFMRLESRLRAMEGADVSRASYAPRSADDDVRSQIEALTLRVARNQRENDALLTKLSGALEANRRDIDDSREATTQIAQIMAELQDHRSVLKTAVVPGLAMRAALTSTVR